MITSSPPARHIRFVSFSKKPLVISISIPISHANNILVKNVAAVDSQKRKSNSFSQSAVIEHQLVLLRVALSRKGPTVEMRQLHPQHRSLQSIEAAVDAGDFVKVFSF